MSLFTSQLRDVRGRERSRRERKKEAKIKKRRKAWSKKFKEDVSPGVTKRTTYSRVKGRRQ